MLRTRTRARFNLMDGTTVEGTVARSWMWWAWKLTRPEVHTSNGVFEASGTVYVARRHVTFVQAMHVETDHGEA